MVLQFGMTHLTILIQLKILKLLKWQKCGRSPFVIYRIQQCVKIRVLYNIFSYLEIFVWFGCKNFYLEVWRLTKAGLCQFFMKSKTYRILFTKSQIQCELKRFQLYISHYPGSFFPKQSIFSICEILLFLRKMLSRKRWSTEEAAAKNPGKEKLFIHV